MNDQLWLTRSRLVRVIDGDTFVVESDMGRDIRHQATLRLRGVDAPKMGTPAGWEAKRAAMRWFAHAEAGALTAWPCYVRTHQVAGRYQEYVDRSGARYVADVYNLAGESLAEALVAAGHAVPWEKA